MIMSLNMPFIITISRQLGCGGAFIGEALAKHFGISYADRDIISATAQKFSMHEKDLYQRDEKIITAWQSFLQSITRGPDRVEHRPLPPTDKELFKAESEVIERLATERSAVIMGRCGSYILRRHPLHVSLFLYASMDFRIKRLCADCSVSETRAQKMIEESDKKRSSYVHQFTGEMWMDATKYDLSVRTDILGVEESAVGIIKFVERLIAEKESRN
jgi:cytidylate kinase